MASRYSPFENLWSWNQMVNNMFDQALVRPYSDRGSTRQDQFVPAADVIQTPESLVFQISLPGYSPDWVNVTATGNTLTVEGQLPQEQQSQQEGNYLLHELALGPFYRQWTLPVEVEADKAEAHFENGVLTLTLPKSESVRPKQIKIAAKSGQKLLTK